MGQLVGCIQGIAEACRALDMPIVSGNVSLYNETDGRAILPTPTIGAVGLLESLERIIRMAPGPDQALVLLGETRGHLAQSAYAWELFGNADGPPPPVDLAAERAAGELVRALHAEGLITAAHDLSDGGLAVAAAEMALAGDTGIAPRRPRDVPRRRLVLRRGPGPLSARDARPGRRARPRARPPASPPAPSAVRGATLSALAPPRSRSPPARGHETAFPRLMGEGPM